METKSKYTLDRPEIFTYLEKILQTDLKECILWPFGQSMGYGIVSRRFASILMDKNIDRPFRIHALICELEHGPPPEGKPQAAHDCANRLCVNRNHIRWQSNQENSSNPITTSRMSISAKARNQQRGSDGRFI